MEFFVYLNWALFQPFRHICKESSLGMAVNPQEVCLKDFQQVLINIHCPKRMEPTDIAGSLNFLLEL